VSRDRFAHAAPFLIRGMPLVEDCIREIDLPGRRILLNPGFIG